MVPRPSAIQDGLVRHPFLRLALSAVALAACAHSRDESIEVPRKAMAEPAAFEREVIAVDAVQPPPEAAPAPRPRLSRTITLGAGRTESDAPYVPSAPPPRAQAAAPSQTVVVNNNVVVQGAPSYTGYGGFYGAGGYGRPTTFYTSDGRSGGSPGGSQWGSTGWEGARRTAAPGHTPGIGGNWAPAPSYGPAPMR
jgi:hypothetical protein